MTIERVGVLGGGLMGSGIAESAAAAGFPVAVREVHEEVVEAARRRIEVSVGHAVDRGKLDDAGRDAILARVELTTDVDDLADVDLVIEAVPEDAALKDAVLRDVASRVSPDAIIASNTSSIPIAQLAAAVPRPERVLGLHFFRPCPS